MLYSQFLPHYSAGHYSPRKPVKPVNFICVAPGAQRVTLARDFNDWNPDAQPLKLHVDGSWQG